MHLDIALQSGATRKYRKISLKKEEIASNFDLAAPHYDEHALVQKKASLFLVTFFQKHLKHFEPKKILDVGSGTGFLTESFISLFPHAHYTLNDISWQMLQKAKEKLPHYPYTSYVQADAETTCFETYFDLIISNLVFQWFDSCEKGLKKLFLQTKCLVFSTLVEGAFDAWQSLCQEAQTPCLLQDFPKANAIKKWCQNFPNSSSYFALQKEKIFFAKPIGFARHLKNIGAHTPKKNVGKTNLRTLQKKFKKDFCVEYKILHGILLKKF